MHSHPHAYARTNTCRQGPIAGTPQRHEAGQVPKKADYAMRTRECRMSEDVKVQCKQSRAERSGAVLYAVRMWDNCLLCVPTIPCMSQINALTYDLGKRVWENESVQVSLSKPSNVISHHYYYYCTVALLLPYPCTVSLHQCEAQHIQSQCLRILHVKHAAGPSSVGEWTHGAP